MENLFELVLTNDTDSGLKAVALVDAPAIELNWMAFSKEVQFKATNPERFIVTGPLMIADKPILRVDPITQETFHVVFRKETIEKAVQKYFKSNRQNTVNMMHNGLATVDGIFMFESFITDTQRGILAPKGFEDVPEGSWFGSFKVDNKEVWEEFISTGVFKGFSIEGFFDMVPVQTELRAVVDDIIALINGTHIK